MQCDPRGALFLLYRKCDAISCKVKKAGDPAKNAEVISLSAVSVIAKIPWENFIPED